MAAAGGLPGPTRTHVLCALRPGHQEGLGVGTRVLTGAGVHYCGAFPSGLERG